MRAKALLLSLASLAVLMGCGGETGITGFAQLRAISAVSSPSEVDVVTDFNAVGSGLSNGEGSIYSSHPATLLNLIMRETGTTQTLLTGTVNAGPNQRYTIIPHQTGADSWAMIALTDNATTPPVTSFQVRFVHVDRFLGSVDVYFVEPGADLSLETPVLTDLSFQTATGYMQLDAGDPREVRVTEANTLTEVGNVLAFTPPGATARTIMIFDDAGTRVEIYND